MSLRTWRINVMICKLRLLEKKTHVYFYFYFKRIILVSFQFFIGKNETHSTFKV